MDLEELKKKIYRPNSDEQLQERFKPSAYSLGQTQEKKQSTAWAKLKNKRLTPAQKKKIKKYLYIAGGVFVIIVAFVFWRGLTSFDQDKVSLEISGPEKITSGDEVTYTVVYENKTRLDLKNIRLVFHYPANSILKDQTDLTRVIELDDLPSGRKKQIDLSVRLIGAKGEDKKAWAELSYQPGNLSSRFTVQDEFETNIIAVPLILDFDLPDKIVSGQEFDFVLTYLNQSETAFNDLEVRLDYPFGFNFVDSNPSSYNDTVWQIDKLEPGEEGRIVIGGSLNGQTQEAKSFKAQLGFLDNNNFVAYTETADALEISSSPLAISQTVNGQEEYIAQAGQTLSYKIIFKNTTDVGIRNAVLTAKLEGSAFDLTDIDLGDGSYDGSSRTITWRASNLSDLAYLAPGQQGEAGFSVSLKDPLPINSFSDKNFSVANTVRIDSSEKPSSLEDIEIAGQSKLTTKISTDFSIQAQAFYNDDTFNNFGPIPPKVNQETAYTIKWLITNTSNDLEGVEVEAFLPPHVKWLGNVSSSGDLNYSSQSGRVVWQIGDLPAATGLLLPAKQIAFQVSIKPGIADVDSLMELIGQTKISAKDEFTSQELLDQDQAIDTNLPDDPSVSHREGVVVQ